MKHPAWSFMILALASTVASANTTAIQSGAAQGRAAPVETTAKEAASTVGQCYALDAAARHECIYAALVKSRTSKSETVH